MAQTSFNTQVLDGITDAFIAFDRDWRFTYVNRNAERYLNKSREELLGKPMFDVFPQGESSPAWPRIRQAAEQHEQVNFEAKSVISDRWYEVRAFPSDEGLSILYRDITERKKEEYNILAQRDWYKVVLESIGDAVIVTDSNSNVVFMNQVAEGLTGFSFDEAEGRSIESILRIRNEYTGEAAEIPTTRVLKEGVVCGLANHTVLIRKDGSHIPIEDSGAPVRNMQGRVIGSVLVFRDTSAERVTERVLRASEERLQLALQAARMGIWEWDIEQNSVSWTEALEEIHGLEPGAFRGTFEAFLEDVHPDDRKRVIEAVGKVVQNRTEYHITYRIVKPDDSVAWIESRGRLLVNETDRPERMLGVCLDVTDRIAAAQALEKREDELQKLNRNLARRIEKRSADLLEYQERLRHLASQLSRTEMKERRRIATELHDNLAQLLTILKMKIVTARDDSAPESFKSKTGSILETLNDAARYTRTLISDLTPPAGLRERDLLVAVEWLQGKFKKYNFKVVVHDDGNAKPLELDTMHTVLQCTQELLFNVLKHSGTQQAVVRLMTKGEWLHVQVEDKGKGFDKQRIESGPSNEGGFGLFNVTEQIDYLGGQITIDSSEGGGTVVDMLIPVKSESDKDTAHTVKHLVRQPVTHVRTSHLRNDTDISVLLADDHEMIRDGLRSIIEIKPGVSVIGEAADGEQTVLKALELHPAVVVMDVNMPVVNGIQATRRIKELLPHTIVIALSINNDELTVRHMNQAGADAYLTKAEASETLRSVIQELCENASTRK